ncbi:MAG: hypothetical protein Q7R81_06540 [Candidatus Peregrinibacteria bacterium]|nr:hypothetical protein [Candidatus Peregrinibacteria bacterium]
MNTEHGLDERREAGAGSSRREFLSLSAALAVVATIQHSVGGVLASDGSKQKNAVKNVETGKTQKLYAIELHDGLTLQELQEKYGIVIIDRGTWHEVKRHKMQLATISLEDEKVMFKRTGDELSIVKEYYGDGSRTFTLPQGIRDGTVEDVEARNDGEQKNGVELATLLEIRDVKTKKDVELPEGVLIPKEFQQLCRDAERHGIAILHDPEEKSLHIRDGVVWLHFPGWQKRLAMMLRYELYMRQLGRKDLPKPAESTQQKDTVPGFQCDVVLKGVTPAELEKRGIFWAKDGYMQFRKHSDKDFPEGAMSKVNAETRRVIVEKREMGIAIILEDTSKKGMTPVETMLIAPNGNLQSAEWKKSQRKTTDTEMEEERRIDVHQKALQPSPLDHYAMRVKNIQTVTVNPLAVQRARGGAPVATQTLDGGFDLTLDHPIEMLKWEKTTLRELAADPNDIIRLKGARYALEKQRSVLFWKAGDSEGRLVLAENASNRGIISIRKGQPMRFIEMSTRLPLFKP